MKQQAGAFAAFTVDILVYPLDTLKTRLQSPDYRRRYLSNASSTRKLLANPAMFRGLYQGVSSAIIATLPSCQSESSNNEFSLTHEKLPTGESNRKKEKLTDNQQEPFSSPTKPSSPVSRPQLPAIITVPSSPNQSSTPPPPPSPNSSPAPSSRPPKSSNRMLRSSSPLLLPTIPKRKAKEKADYPPPPRQSPASAPNRPSSGAATPLSPAATCPSRPSSFRSWSDCETG